MLVVKTPAGVKSAIGPVTTPAGTLAPMVVLLVIWKLVAGTPPKVMFVVPMKLFPVIFTVVPGGLLVGVKLVIAAGK